MTEFRVAHEGTRTVVTDPLGRQAILGPSDVLVVTTEGEWGWTLTYGDGMGSRRRGREAVAAFKARSAELP